MSKMYDKELIHNFTPLISYRFWCNKDERMYDVRSIHFDKDKLPDECLVVGTKNSKSYLVKKDLKNGHLIPSTELFDSDKKEIYFGDIIKCKFIEVYDDKRVVIYDNGYRILGYTCNQFLNLSKLCTIKGNKWENKVEYDSYCKSIK